MHKLVLSILVSALVLTASTATAQCSLQNRVSTADPQDKFGRGVAVGGRFVAVSAPNDSSIFDQEGKVFVYRDVGGTWMLAETLQPAGLDPLDLFGFSVAADGVRLAASALFDDDQGVDSGAVYVYSYDTGSWVLEQKLANPTPGDQLSYGRAIAMTSDVLAVAKWGPPAVVYVYRRSGAAWNLEATLAPSFADQRFGTDVATSGNLIVVGDPEFGISEGAIEVYRFTPGAGWASDYVAFGTIGSSFGETVDAFRNRVVAGAWETGSQLGLAEVHAYDNTTATWSLEQSLLGSDSVAGDGFGFTVSLSGLGLYAGAPGHDSLGTNTGAVYAFTFSGGSWTQVNKLAPGDLLDFDNFGTTMDVAGALLAVGNRFQVPDPGMDSRAVYIFLPCP